jgi:hypothetical protein
MKSSDEKCIICGKDVYKDRLFCRYHYEAYKNLREAYPIWKERLNITEEEYLILIQKNPYAGKWVKELATYLRKVKRFDI